MQADLQLLGVLATGRPARKRPPDLRRRPVPAPVQVVDVHGDFDAAVPLDDEESYRAVVCLRRLAQ